MKKRERRSTCLLSHPNKCLKDHLKGVSEEIKENFPIKDKVNLAELTGLFHDLGKALPEFQKFIKLISEGEEERARKVKNREHSLPSAVALFSYLTNELKVEPLEAFLSFLSVKNHHSFPKDAFEEEVNKKEPLKSVERLKKLKKENLKEIGIPERTLDTLKEEKILEKLRPFGRLRRFRKLYGKPEDFSLYVLFMSLYSTLLYSDRKDASGTKINFRNRINFKEVKKIIDSIPRKREIDELRQRTKEEVLSKPFDPSKRIYSINLPTGLGKTYTGFLFALKVKEELQKLTQKPVRIIYTLPFISIIDQTYEALKEVIEKAIGFSDSTLITKHHHLTELSYRKEGEELPFDQAKILTEGWESEVIVTTMVQLFNSLFPKNRSQALRFSRLSNSVVILDEIQTLPAKYWILVEKLIGKLSEKLNFYLIFMTATKPALFKEHYELAGKKFFVNLKRYEVEIEKEEKNLEEFCSSLELKGSSLFILNTVRSSQEVFNRVSELTGCEVEYLSRSVTPYERRERLKRIRAREVKYLVSTQIVEAGVDVDFEYVLRDFAPFDSLNQSAGRCNRNMESRGNFKVVNLIDENGKKFSSYIYDRILLEATEETLKNKKKLTEEEFLNLTEEYFNIVRERGVNSKKSKYMIDSVKLLRFRNSRNPEFGISEFKLIEEDYGTEVFVQLNEDALNIWEKTKELVEKLRRGNREVLEEIFKVKHLFYDFVVSVSERELPLPFDETLSLYFVPIENLRDFYDKKVGLNVRGAL